MESNRVEKNGHRFYEFPGRDPYPSVTTIIDIHTPQGLKDWESSHPDPDGYRDKWSRIGNMMHYLVLSKSSIRELEPPSLAAMTQEDISMAKTAAVVWDRHVDIEVHGDPHIERRLRSDDHRYAGTADFIGKISSQSLGLEEEVVTLDLKSTPRAGEFDKVPMQLAAYKVAAQERGLASPEKAVCVSLCGDPSRVDDLSSPNTWVYDSKDLGGHFDRFMELKKKFESEVRY